jgi:hypothetical protein
LSKPVEGFSNPFDVTQESCTRIELNFSSVGTGTFICSGATPLPFDWKVINSELCVSSATQAETCLAYAMEEDGEKFTLGTAPLSIDFMQTMLSMDLEEIPTDISLHQNYPNPFNPSTTIEFDVGISANVSLVVYDLTGKEISSLASGYYMPGRYSVVWNAIDLNGESVSSGMYIYQLRTSSTILTKKLVLLR